MSPHLDSPLDRREAVSAQSTSMDRARLNGVFLGFANRQQTSTRLRVFVEDNGVWARVSPLSALDSDEAPVLTSSDPAVVQFVTELIGLFPTEGEPVGPR